MLFFVIQTPNEYLKIYKGFRKFRTNSPNDCVLVLDHGEILSGCRDDKRLPIDGVSEKRMCQEPANVFRFFSARGSDEQLDFFI